MWRQPSKEEKIPSKMRSLLDQIEEAVWEDDAVVANELVDKCKSIIDAVEEYHGGF